jgi:hypothetical protein
MFSRPCGGFGRVRLAGTAPSPCYAQPCLGQEIPERQLASGGPEGGRQCLPLLPPVPRQRQEADGGHDATHGGQGGSRLVHAFRVSSVRDRFRGSCADTGQFQAKGHTGGPGRRKTKRSAAASEPEHRWNGVSGGSCPAVSVGSDKGEKRKAKSQLSTATLACSGDCTRRAAP